MKILLVDDFSTMRRIIGGLLKELGFADISEAEDGMVALRMLHKNTYDFVITDWNMPNMTGLELLKSIRADSQLSTIPVLMITAEAKKENIILAAQSGASGYIVKPFNAIILNEKITKILEKIGN